MKKYSIAILGSTGSIGKSLLNIVSKNNNKFKIVLLTANKNYKLILKQAIKFNVKNVIITNKKYFNLAKLKNKNNKTKIYNNFKNLNIIFPKKIDYVMSSIVGLDGLKPTLNIIKYTKKIAIANKESIICAWNLIRRELKKQNTNFIPVDSEHFSIWYALNNNLISNVDKIYLTASGGPLLNVPTKKFDRLKTNKILDHPTWKMGPKISVDSSNLVNKVFEIIEAKKIFNFNYNQLKIIIHPNSYVHAILEFNDGMIKIIAHETTMEIPIFNSIYFSNKQKIKTKNINFKKLNNLNFQNVDINKFPSVQLIKKLPPGDSLYETALVTANDEFVKLYIDNKISYKPISSNLIKIMNDSSVKKFKKILPRNVSQVINTSKYIRNKITVLYN